MKEARKDQLKREKAFSVEYEVIRSDRRSFAAQIKQNRLIIRAPLNATNEQIDSFVRRHSAWIESHLAKARERQEIASACPRLTDTDIRALVEKASEVIPERVRFYVPTVGVRVGHITIRNQRTRWGSCSSKGNLNFNCLLMLTPPEVIDSVVVHELCHLKEMNHSERFYSEVLRVFPEYRKCEKWLKDNGGAIMAMME